MAVDGLASFFGLPYYESGRLDLVAAVVTEDGVCDNLIFLESFKVEHSCPART
jgi:hypothetical protein